jgi:hypothetical protein
MKCAEPRAIRSSLSLPFKKIIWQETRGHCVYCGMEIPNSDRSVDHVVPVCRGGSSALDNLVAACKPCNHRRGLVYPPHVLAHPDWVEYVKAKENAHFDMATVKAEKNMRLLFKQKDGTDRVMSFFDGGSVSAGPEGIKVMLDSRVVALLSWKDVGRHFCMNFNSELPKPQ